MYLSDIEIILCRVSDPGNAGAVCRVMKNMGLSKLRLVAPLPDDEELLLKRAVHAEDIWEKARVYNSLADAAADCSLLIGTTRRRGRRRKSVSMDPRTLAAWLAERPIPETGPVGIVFGNERTGLEDAELDLCNIASHIPVSDTQPSLNLSHAVQIYAYELFLALEPQTQVKGEWTAMNRAQVLTLVSSLTDTLESLGFYRNPGREEQTRFLIDIISRAGLSDREGKYFKDIISKAARLGIMKN
ncbi:MAG: TrmJ/YjtD family RNA methyltransferase [Treponema sp.]|jgi:tRNA/rRNA methyltransferase/tRNA (cytidine32/uridine32-2'-O)-methyltransferase|nr:TrmJ/YjtD family RNA methyltransferase [Treponema sp.]